MSRERATLLCQANSCDAMGSPLYRSLLTRAADGSDGGVALRLLASRPAGEDLLANGIVLRLMAAVHRLALAGSAPALAAHYPSCGGDTDHEAAWSGFVSALRGHEATIRADLDRPVQTNEVGWAAPLLGGFLHVAERFGLPLRLLELGASAGLMLRWDAFRYGSAAWSWGPVRAGVRLTDHFEDVVPPFTADTRVRIAERAGCDLAPIDPSNEADRRRLVSFVWADQTERIARLVAACEVARAIPATIERCGAATWLAKRLATRRNGVVTVVFHTVVLQYLPVDERAALANSLAEAGARATFDAPLAYLSLEPLRNGNAEVLLRLWPGDREIEISRASLHGRNVRWTRAGADSHA